MLTGLHYNEGNLLLLTPTFSHNCHDEVGILHLLSGHTVLTDFTEREETGIVLQQFPAPAETRQQSEDNSHQHQHQTLED